MHLVKCIGIYGIYKYIYFIHRFVLVWVYFFWIVFCIDWMQATQSTAKIAQYQGVPGVLILDSEPGHHRVQVGFSCFAVNSLCCWKHTIPQPLMPGVWHCCFLEKNHLAKSKRPHPNPKRLLSAFLVFEAPVTTLCRVLLLTTSEWQIKLQFLLLCPVSSVSAHCPQSIDFAFSAAA